MGIVWWEKNRRPKISWLSPFKEEIATTKKGVKMAAWSKLDN
jgi:hypothetical protein